MKDLSFFLLKNYLGAKMRKGIRNFCNGDASTSTLDQHNKASYTADDHHCFVTPSVITSPCIHMSHADTAPQQSSPTLEQMILQLELEEEFARKAKLNNYVDVGLRDGRMSCVNNSDILRSARNALNQYPRFSLDGKDAMYRSSFRNLDSVGKAEAGRKSVCCDSGLRERMNRNNFGAKFERKSSFPPTLTGKRVVWCKPGVIAKLMGLEAMPVPINSREDKETLASIIKRQNLRIRAERHDIERRMAGGVSDFDGIKRGRSSMPSCSKPGYCVTKPVAVEPANDGGGLPTRRNR
ncbi:hypothetical protein SADUNF_Sadunf01G0001300 [Salix dunnii]|uniref:DUF3741 domain-containing protein n=1 Tax=Salix dunnii TaxID=1413687 RepID=A0A835TKJ5_9ROSI|nr:hypothetical protein SADUNF_Sadunf01G0001300 [Salix dunnii]